MKIKGLLGDLDTCSTVSRPGWVKLVVVILLVFSAAATPAATNDPALALQKGLFEEEANHDFNAAIRAYQAVIKQFDQDRKLAATAVFRLGECYRKQGNTNDANAQYERVIREFSDQPPLVTLSRSYLAASGQTSAGNVTPPAPPSEEADEVRRIQAMIKDSPDLINARAGSGQTPLHRAAGEGQATVATFLLENGAEVDAKDRNGQTPLHVAAAQGHKEMVELLLAHKADVQARRNDAATPTALHIAAERGLRTLVELLLARKADVNARSSSGPTPLHVAAAKGFKVIAEVLIRNGADVNAMASGFAMPPLNNPSGTPLHIAAQRGDEAMAELLLEHKAEPNSKLEDSQTPLHTAAINGHEAVAKLLLDHGAEVNARTKNGYTPLALAISWQSIAVAKALLAGHADPNITFQSDPSSERTPLYLTVANQNADAELVRLLLQGRANPNVKDDQDHHFTPLIEAVRYQNKEVVSILLAAKADPNIPDNGGQTALHFAVPEPSITEALLSTKAGVNAKEYNGETPLHWAAGCGLKPAAELLLAHAAEINARDTLGNTPLHFAVLAGRTETVDFLLAKGADPNVPNQNGKTPLDWSKTGLGDPGAASWIQIPGKAAFLRPSRSRPPGGVFPPGIPQGGAVNASRQAREEIASTLKSHGALEDLPHLDRIEVGRPAQNYSAPIFSKDTNDWNQFTALEVLAVELGLLSGNAEGEGGTYDSEAVWARSVRLPFPDLENAQIRRPEADLKTWHERKVDLSPVLNSGDCSKDVPLAWGEVVEVPEADHPLNERWSGFSDAELTNLVKCLSREVTVVIKGRPTKLKVGSQVEFYSGPKVAESEPNARVMTEPKIHTKAPLWLKPALRRSNLLLASSDLSRVKVTRHDPATGQRRQWVLDCSDLKPAPAFWLRDGDVIDVPEKP